MASARTADIRQSDVRRSTISVWLSYRPRFELLYQRIQNRLASPAVRRQEAAKYRRLRSPRFHRHRHHLHQQQYRYRGIMQYTYQTLNIAAFNSVDRFIAKFGESARIPNNELALRSGTRNCCYVGHSGCPVGVGS